MADKVSLVAQIKDLQRAGPEQKQAWWDYADSVLAGARDPAKHDADTLQAFLAAYHGGSLPKGQITPSQPRKSGGGMGMPMMGMMGGAMPMMGGGKGMMGGGMQMMGGAGGGANFVDFIKLGQRQSQSWKNAWQTYCTNYGTGKADPAGYPQAFITGFIEFAGNQAMNSMGGATGGPMQGAFDEPNPKRQRVMGPGPMIPGAFNGGDPQKNGLVNQIKELQRSNPQAKESWWQFCDTTLGGVRDPNKHDADTLKVFLAEFGGVSAA